MMTDDSKINCGGGFHDTPFVLLPLLVCMLTLVTYHPSCCHSLWACCNAPEIWLAVLFVHRGLPVARRQARGIWLRGGRHGCGVENGGTRLALGQDHDGKSYPAMLSVPYLRAKSSPLPRCDER